jgi:hypothetical protein
MYGTFLIALFILVRPVIASVWELDPDEEVVFTEENDSESG